MPSASNPYIIGRPIFDRGGPRFFGREDVFRFIENALREPARVILMHGQRRIGKTSVLRQIPHQVKLPGFSFVYFDLQAKAGLPLGSVLHELAEKIAQSPLFEQCPPVGVPPAERMEADPAYSFAAFLDGMESARPDAKLVLVLDEFDVLGNYKGESAGEHLFPFLRGIIDAQERGQERLFLIAVVGRRLDEIENLLGLFHSAPHHEIGLLDRPSAERLITEPARGLLDYPPAAIDTILALSAGHPYFTQLLCHVLFDRVQVDRTGPPGPIPIVPTDTVEQAVDRALEAGEPGLLWFRDGLPIPERVFFSAMAEVQSNPERAVLASQAVRALQEHGVVITPALSQAPERLLSWGFLRPMGGIQAASLRVPSLQVTIELVRRWLVRSHPLQRVIWELAGLSDAEAQAYLASAEKARDTGRGARAMEDYREVLKRNPNHLGALQEAAELALQAGPPAEAVELFRRAIQVDPARNTERLSLAERRLAESETKSYTPAPAGPPRLYAAYVDADESQWGTLYKHLTLARRKGLVEIVEPAPGETREDARERAEIVLLFISRRALIEDSFYDEMEWAMAQQRRGVRVIPILLDRARIGETPVAGLQPLPQGGIPISEWSDEIEVWTGVADGIGSVLREVARAPESERGQAPRSAPPPLRSVTGPLRAVILSASADYELRRELEKHLISLTRLGQLTYWHAGMLSPGEDGVRSWRQHLSEADLVLVLVSVDLLVEESGRLDDVARWVRSGSGRMLPIHLRALDLDGTLFEGYRPVPQRPITSLPGAERDVAWAEVVRAIRQVISMGIGGVRASDAPEASSPAAAEARITYPSGTRPR